MSTGPTRVTLLTQDACSLCHHAKDVLARVGHDLPLEVEEIDRTSLQGRELATRSGVLFAPGVLLDGSPFAFGRLSERKLRKHLRAASSR